MRILGIDTSSSKLSLAIIEKGKIIGDFNLNLPKEHSRYLVPSIDKLLKKTKLSLNKIDALAISIGPGSFTGLRIGVATVKALAIAKRKKVMGISSLDVLAYNGLEAREEYICPIIDAKKDKVYAAIYQKNGNGLKKHSKDLLISIQDLLKILNKPTLFLGDAIRIYEEKILQQLDNKAILASEKLWFPQAKFVAMLGEKMARKNKFINPLDLVPRYLHKRDCQIKLPTER